MRFTNKDGTICYWWDKRNEPEEIHKQELANQKLCALEDIEEEIGVDLITLFTALENGVYRWHINVYGDYDKSFVEKVFQEVELDISSRQLYHVSEISRTATWKLNLKDYGKTWALTKKELK